MIIIKLLDILDKKERSLNWLSNNAGITYSTLYNFAHRNTGSVTYDILEKLCLTLKCNVSDIIEYVPENMDIAPKSRLNMLEELIISITNKKNEHETIHDSEMLLIYDLLVEAINNRSKLSESEKDRFHKIYIACLRLLPYDLSSQALQIFISNINTSHE